MVVPLVEFDYIVLGVGVGGSTFAQRAASKGASVACVDLGQAHETKPFSANELVLSYKKSGLTTSLGRSPIPIAEAAVVGGGSAVNSGLVQRADSDLWDEFVERFGISEWCEKTRDRYYNEAEALLPLEASPPQGGRGAMLELAAASLGWKTTRVSKLKTGEGRHSANLFSLFESQIRESGGRLFVGRVRDCFFSKGWNLGLTISSGETRIRARKLVLACGAIETPHVLQRLIQRKWLGYSTFKAHLFSKAIFAYDRVVPTAGGLVDSVQVKEFAPDISLGCSVLNPFLSKLNLAARHSWSAFEGVGPERLAMYYAMTRQSGRFHSLSGGREKIYFHRLANDDVQKNLRALRLLLDLGQATSPVAAFVPSIKDRIESPWPNIDNMSEKNLALSSVHIMASLPMGETGASVVNSLGRVSGHPALFVSDASLIPDCIGVNPQLTVMALALRVADYAATV